MKTSPRILLGLTWAVVITGIAILASRAVRGMPIPTSYLLIWIVVSVILGGTSLWAWLRNRKK
jgi:hypothetical protein